MIKRLVAPVLGLVALLSMLAFVVVSSVGAQTTTPGAGTTTTGTGTARPATSTTGTSTTGTVAPTTAATTAPTATRAATSAAASATGTGGATLPTTGQPRQDSSSPVLGILLVVGAAIAAVVAGFAFRRRAPSA
jgi:penicillin-binding protein 2A